MTRPRRCRPPIIALWVLLSASGCLQVDTRIRLHEDGSATITEKLRFSKALLDLESTDDPALKLRPLLQKQAALDRLKHMGKGIRLVSHKVREAEKGSRESVAVFKIPDLNDFRYVSPFLAYADYPKNNVIRVRLYPLYKSESYVGTAGEMAVLFWPTKNPQRHHRPKKGERGPKRPSPVDLQVFRELRPVFRDVLREFKVRLTFESYAPIRTTGFGLRGQKAGVNHVDMINVSDTDLDRYGSNFFENEEVMVDLIQLKWGSQNVVAHTRGFASNHTVPLFLCWGSRFAPWRGSSGIFFRPSRALFDRHFQGKKLDYGRWAKSPPNKLVPARFERIGYRKDKTHARKPK